MKGQVSIVAVLILWVVTLTTWSLEVHLGGGPSAASLDEINAVIYRFNTIIEHLNETAIILESVTGKVDELDLMRSGAALYVGERAWLSDRLGLGGTLDVLHTATSTAGTYVSSESSEISISLGCTTIGLAVNGRYNFLSAGVVLSVDLGIGYTYTSFNRDITFQIPPEYPEAISGLPPEGVGRYSGFAPKVEAGLALLFPITEWLKVGSSLSYSVLTLAKITDDQGNDLDLDGNGTVEKLDLGGIGVRFTLSLSFDLTPEGEKE